MADMPLNEPAGVLVKTTCVDFPGRVAGSFFLKGCNLRCPYCYNTGLVLGFDENGNISENLSTIEELFSHLEKRQGILTGLTISGGEPLLNPYTPLIIKKARTLGYKIKLDTNGTLPYELQSFIENEELRPDYIAMDIKTSPSRYATEICNPKSKFYGNSEYFEKNLKLSADLVAGYNPDSREYRTVLVPGLVTKADIERMAAVMPGDASWRFAQFRNENCLNPAYNEIYPYADSEAMDIVGYAKTFIADSELR